MPITASLTSLGSAITASWSLNKGAKIDTTSKLFISAVSAAASTGLISAGISMIPLAPVGMTAAQSALIASMSMGKGAKINTVSKLTAQAISAVAPMCPPVGLSTLGVMIQSSMQMGQGAKVSTVSRQVAQAIISYYMAGGVV